MSLPESFTLTDVLAGIVAYLAGAVDRGFSDSTKCDLLHEGCCFPPKAISAIAIQHGTGQLPVPSYFSGGADSGCFRILRDAGFRIAPKPGLIPFDVGRKYTWKQVGDCIGTHEDTTKGDWATGYYFHEDRDAGIIGWWFVFPTVGDAGRSGHDYTNRWLSDAQLEWSGKSRSTLGQNLIDSHLSGEHPDRFFSRSNDRDPFTYHGLAKEELRVKSQVVDRELLTFSLVAVAGDDYVNPLVMAGLVVSRP